MFYLLKHLSLPYVVIIKQRCNNIISTLIMSFYALNVYLCILTSSRIPSIDLEVMDTSFLRWFYHNDAKELYAVAEAHANATIK
jgi:hypothetical protein